jgi:pimeloyl-ACP methyl ester carboxylesterase
VKSERSQIERQTAHQLLLLGIATLLLSSCQIFGLRQHVETMEAFGVVAIRVSPLPTDAAATYALAWTSENGELRSAGVYRVTPDGIAAFTLRTDRSYTVGAFTDENANHSYDAGEPADYVRGVRPRSLGDPNVEATMWKLSLQPRHGLPPGTTIAIPKENRELGGQLNLALGEVVSLEDKRFATDAGGSGLWRPLDFLNNNRLGIYFTEPYDPSRVPVLLVYGIGGTPQDFRYFADHFDRKRYQVWLFHYPSGMRLERVARAMATGLNLLRERHGFTRCHVVAHSMGGLVARAGIEEAVRSAGVNFIARFVSISTPWGGHQAASAGIRRLKKPVPSWLDVAPESEFLREIYETPLPAGTRYLLIYGSKEGGPFWVKGENDGVVTVASETDPRIKNDAASVVHLPYGHVEILEQNKTLAETLRFLAGG